jgi:hypothetical protein
MRRLIVLFTFLSIFLTIVGQPANVRAQAEETQEIEIGLSDLNGGQPVNISGLFGSAALDIRIPDTFRVRDQSWLSIKVKSSQVLDQDRSSLTINLNERQLASYRLSQFADGVMKIDLSGGIFHQGLNTLTFTAMLHLPDDNETACSNWDDPSRWLEISLESSLHLVVSPTNFALNLASFPQAFVEPINHYLAGTEKNETTFVLPDEPSLDDLTSLVSLAYLFGHHAGQNFRWQPQVVSERSGNLNVFKDRGIVLLRSERQVVAPPSVSGIDFMLMRNSVWDISHPLLYLSDHNPQDGFSPVQILGDPIRRAMLRSNLAYLEPSRVRPPAPLQNDYTFEQLGYLNRTARGIGESSLIYSLFIPYNIEPTNAHLRLVISHSPDLDAEVSSILVYLNGFTVAGIVPSANSAQFEPIEVNLPAARFRPGENFIRLTFDLQLPYSSCERAPQSVWATVDASSSLHIGFNQVVRTPTLDDYPMPYSNYPGFAFVIPDNYNLKTLEYITSLAFQFGQSSQLNYQLPVVFTSSQFTPETTDRVNLIFVGLPTENPHIFSINRLMPQPFTEDGNSLEPGYGIYLPEPDEQAAIGLLETLTSPWSNDGIILVVTGTDTQSLDWTWDVLLDPDYAQKFSGNVLMVGSGARLAGGDGDTPAVSFVQSPEVSRFPVVGRLFQKLEPSDVFPVLVSVETALLVLLALLAVLRWRDRNS